MFRAGASQAGSTSSLNRVAPHSGYQSFQAVFNAKKEEIRAKRKRPIDVSSDSSDSSDQDDDQRMETSDDAPEVLYERIRSRRDGTKKKKKKDHRKEKRHKSHKKKHKKRRETSESSSSEMEIEPPIRLDPSVFCYHPFKRPTDYNTLFSKQLKKRALNLDSSLPLTTTRDPKELGHKLYPFNENLMSWRYFAPENAEKLRKGATERVFRPRPTVKEEEGFIPVSKERFKPEEENDAETYAEYASTMSMKEYELMKDRRWADPDTMSMDRKKELVQSDLNSDDWNPEQWMAFIKFEDEYYAHCNQVQGHAPDFNRPAYLERRLEIIKQALKKVRKDEAIDLQLELLNTMSEQLGPHHKDVRDKWSKIQNTYINSEVMWKAFISDQIHGLSGFNITNAEIPYSRAISRLDNLFNKRMVSHKTLDGTEDFLIDLIVARCKLFLESGHVAYVIGNLQAIAEFMLFMSDETKQQSHFHRVDEFKEFSESGMPRIDDLDAKGWKDTVLDHEAREKTQRKMVENAEKLTQEIDELDCLLVQQFSKVIDCTLTSIWLAMETNRSQRCWSPLVPNAEFKDETRFQNIEQRLVPFAKVQPSLVQLSSPTKALLLIFRILQLFGVKVPGMFDNTQQGTLDEILPDDFAFLQPNYVGIKDFVVEFLFKLIRSAETIEIGHVLTTAVSAVVHFLQVEGQPEDERNRYLMEIQLKLLELSVDRSHRFFALLRLLDVKSEGLGLAANWSGLDLTAIDGEGKNPKLKELVESFLRMVGDSDPCRTSDNQKQQLQAAISLVRRLPSRWAAGVDSKFTRLRFLFMLVTDKVTDFLDEAREVDDETEAQAAILWNAHFSKVLDDDTSGQNKRTYSFIDPPHSAIIMLHAILHFEITGRCLFADFHQKLPFFITRTRDRILLRLNYVEEMVKWHKFSWRQYCRWTQKAADEFPQHPPFLRHLSRVFAAKPCHIVQMAAWKREQPTHKTVHALAIFAAKLTVYYKALENDDVQWSRTVSKEMQRILEDAAPMLSDSYQPDSLIWRIWLQIQQESRARSEMEKVYILGVRSCPFSKHFLMEVARNPFTSKDKLVEVIDLAEKHGLCMFTILKEATAIDEAATNVRSLHLMAQHFDSSAGFGMDQPTGFRALSHPLVVLSHVGFRGLALFVYFFANWFWSSFIVQLLIILTLLSADFWTVKNITGRLLVGLRWWNIVDSEGKNHWKFESARDPTRFDATERYIFWVSLVVAPALWILFVITAFLTFKWEWMVVAILGAGMSSANFYGYLRCKWNNTTEMTNYFTKLAFLSFLSRQSTQQPPSGPTTTV